MPQRKAEAEALLKLMEQPIRADEATDKLHHLMGDDDLFDVIGKVDDETNGEGGVRVFVKTKLAEFLTHTELAFKPWEPEALALLLPACADYLPEGYLEADGRT